MAHAGAQAIIDQALCHAALVYERLIYVERSLGILPQTSSADDPLGPIVVSDREVETILAGFRRIEATAPAERPGLLGDLHGPALAASRARLRRLVDEAAAVGLARLIRSFAIPDAALDVLVAALAPEWDLRIARLAGYLNNDLTRRRLLFGHAVMAAQAAGLPVPGVEPLALLERALFAPGLLERIDDPSVPFACREVRVPAYLVELSLAVLDEPAPLAAWPLLLWPEPAKQSLRESLQREIRRAGERRLILLQGPPGSGRASAAHATAAEAGIGLVEHQLARDPERARDGLARAAYQARLSGSALAVRWGHPGDGAALLGWLAELCRRLDLAAFVLLGAGDLDTVTPEIPCVRLETPRLGPADRRALWQATLADIGLSASALDIDELSARYDVSPGRLREVARELALRGGSTVTVQRARETLREITGQRLTNLAKRHAAAIRLPDLLFPASVRDRIAELVHRLRLRHRVLSGWNFADKAHESYGTSILFVGPPGTGKTAAAAAIANELEIDLYVVDLSRIMSKWVGETEQNLARVFDEAEASSVALLFDEADALFGKRTSEQRGGADRFANVTVNYLLQRMETYSGLAILTTNLATAMDEAFQRRITTTIRFPPADDELREQLWRHLLPEGVRFADDVDLGGLARGNRMEGAHIRRALTRAAFRAAVRSDRPELAQEDLAWAASAEYEDMGRLS